MLLLDPRKAVALASLAALSLAVAPATAQPSKKAPALPTKGAPAPAKGGAPPAAHPGQPGHPGTPPADEDPAKLVAEGQKAMKAGKWEEARVLLQKAYTLKPGWRIAGELGRAEVGAQKFRDGAEHLALALREAPDNLPEEERKGWEDALGTALPSIGVIRTNVHPDGAEILVNGKSAGTAPLAAPIFVDPGAVVIEAKMKGYFGLKATRTLAGGGEETVELSLHRSGSVDIPPPAANSPEGIFRGVKKPIVISGAAVAAAGTLAGAVFAILSAIKVGQSHKLETPEGRVDCADTCKDQFDALQKQKVTFAGASMWSFIGAGAVLLGTGAYVTVTVITRPKQSLKAGLTVRPDQLGGNLTFQW